MKSKAEIADARADIKRRLDEMKTDRDYPTRYHNYEQIERKYLDENGKLLFVRCRDICLALDETDPDDLEEIGRALEHWKKHSHAYGCSHGR